jgi:hypothetical protein
MFATRGSKGLQNFFVGRLGADEASIAQPMHECFVGGAEIGGSRQLVRRPGESLLKEKSTEL